MQGKVILLSRDTKFVRELELIIPSGIELSSQSDIENARGADVVFLDVESLGIGNLNRLNDDSFIIVVTSKKGARYLVESMTFGAFDCLFRPLDRKNVLETLDRALGIRSELRSRLIQFHGDIEGSSVTCAIVGDSPILQEVCKLIGQVGRVDVPVLITGESGTGKDLVAESI